MQTRRNMVEPFKFMRKNNIIEVLVNWLVISSVRFLYLLSVKDTFEGQVLYIQVTNMSADCRQMPVIELPHKSFARSG